MRVSMTRENKLALIVGFGLVLFMGILVSDHLSTARRQSAATFEFRSAINRQPAIQGDGWVVYGASTSDTRSTDDLELGISQTSPIDTTQPLPIADTGSHSPHHIVASGDTLQSICQRHYGNRNLAASLAAYNRIANPNRLKTNTRLLLPPANLLMTNDPSEVSMTPDSTPMSAMSFGPERPVAVESKSQTMGEYTVQTGDTLSELAQKLLGSARETERLYELNRDVLRHQDDLRVGASLRYPISN